MLDRIRISLMARLAKQYSGRAFKADPWERGIWIAYQKGDPIPIRTRTLGIPVYLSYRQTIDLRNVCFAIDAYSKAKAKLDLYSSIRDAMAAQDVLDDPNEALARTMESASLTANEILTITFAADSPTVTEYYCPQCVRNVTMEDGVYHPECAVTRWLVKYFPFLYEDGRLTTVEMSYLLPRQREVLEIILEDAETLSKQYVKLGPGNVVASATTAHTAGTQSGVSLDSILAGGSQIRVQTSNAHK